MSNDTQELRHKRRLLIDTLTNAANVAAQLQAMTEGSCDAHLFGTAKRAIAELRDDHPAMKALTEVAYRNRP